MSEEKAKRTRRSRSEVIQEKIAKAQADKEKYTQKIAELDEKIKEYQDELNEERIGEVLSVIEEKGLSIDEAIEKLRS